MEDIDFMRLALEEAQFTLDKGGLPVGSVLVLDGRVVAKNHKLTEDFYLGHAEIRVLNSVLQNKRFPKDKSFTLYTTIEPCIMCFGAILHCPVWRLVYALEDPWGGATQLNNCELPVRHKKNTIEITGGVLREEARDLAKKFLEITDDPYWNDKTNNFVQTILK